jgi:hypothetical protein
VPPTATITTTVIANPTALASIPVTVTFSEPVVFTAGQLTLGNGVATAFAGGPTVYTFTLAAQAPGTPTTVAIGIGVFADAVGNLNAVAPATLSRTFDVSGPSVTINQAASQANPTSGASIAFTVLFSAPVSGFTSAGVTLSGTAGGVLAASVSGSGVTYTVTVTGMSSSGTVAATIPADAAQDGSGNPSFASTSTTTASSGSFPPASGHWARRWGHRAAPPAASSAG